MYFTNFVDMNKLKLALFLFSLGYKSYISGILNDVLLEYITSKELYRHGIYLNVITCISTFDTLHFV